MEMEMMEMGGRETEKEGEREKERGERICIFNSLSCREHRK